MIKLALENGYNKTTNAQCADMNFQLMMQSMKEAKERLKLSRELPRLDEYL